jgi:5'-nucleotidase
MDKPGIDPRSFLRRILLFLIIGSSLAFAEVRVRILISNDDGYQDPGLRVLVTKLAPLAELVVAAPSVNQSGVGHGMTFKEPFVVESWASGGVRWFSIAALPATCVRIALVSLLDKKPDVVIAGINRGENVGVVTFSSGTVACAREAAFRGIPGISMNLQRGTTMDYDGAADFVVALVEDLREKRLASGTYLNVNYPALPKDQVKGVLITRQDIRPPNERYEKVVSPQGKVAYRSLWEPLTDGNPDTDTAALGRGFISVTPLQVDQTQPLELEPLRSWRCLKILPAPTKSTCGRG